MKTMTFERFNEIVKEDQEKRDALSKEINDLLRKESEMDAAAQAAANAGNVDEYTARLEEKNKISVALFVKRQCLDNMPKPDLKNEAQEAWSDYASDYNKKLTKALADFKAEKEKLLKMYSDMVDLQREALTARRQIGKTVDVDEKKFPMEFIPCRHNISGVQEKGLLKLPGFSSGDADACYFLANYCEKNNTSVVRSDGTRPADAEERRITNVVVLHNPEIRLW